MNLDDVLAGAEMAKQYPVAPSMPIHAPSDPQRASPADSPLPSSGSQRHTPQSSGQVSTCVYTNHGCQLCQHVRDLLVSHSVCMINHNDVRRQSRAFGRSGSPFPMTLPGFCY